MQQLKNSLVLLIVLTTMTTVQTFAQNLFNFDGTLKAALDKRSRDRAKDVMQDNEYRYTGDEDGKFFCNPLLLNGEPLDYSMFGLGSTGALTVIKGAATTGRAVRVPFYIYLRRDGKKVVIEDNEALNTEQTEIELSEILKYAEPNDQLVIEPARKEDGPAKRILKLLGC